MAEIVNMPKQGLQMTEGTIIEWLVDEGGTIVAGEPFFEMETDKLTITIDAGLGGKLLKILAKEGDTVEIMKPIAIVGDEGEDISALLEEAARASVDARAPEGVVVGKPEPIADVPAVAVKVETIGSEAISRFASPRAKEQAASRGVDYRLVKGSGPEGFVVERDVLAYADVQPKATPLAQVVARQEKVSLDQLAGTGDGGKIRVDDVYQAMAGRSSTAGYAAKDRGEKLVPLSGMRTVVSTRMKESLHIMAQANHTVDVDMSSAVSLRDDYKNLGYKVSYNDIIMRCTAKALTEFPIMNSSMTAEGIALKHYVNLGMAVALPEGLIVPVIADADLLNLLEISAVASDLAVRAKENRLQPDEYSAGTFTVSNLGMYDITSFTAIINPPEAGILAIGKIEKRAVVRDDEIVVRPMVSLCLTYDHRVIDGAPAAEFLRRVKQLIEHPYFLI